MLKVNLYVSLSGSRSPGRDGAVSRSNIQSGTLNRASKRAFPVDLIKIMRRQAEDLLLANSNDQRGRDALGFILSLANERNDIGKIKKGESSSISLFTNLVYNIPIKYDIHTSYVMVSSGVL